MDYIISFEIGWLCVDEFGEIWFVIYLFVNVVDVFVGMVY